MIKIRFFLDHVVWWNVWESIYESCEEDPDIDALVVMNGSNGDTFYSKSENLDRGKRVLFKDYDVVSDNPDIILHSAPLKSNSAVLSEARKNGCILVGCQTMMMISEYKKEHWVYSLNGSYMDYYCVDSALYNRLIKWGIKSEKVIKMGNPKYDGIYNKLISKENLPDKWKKLIGKKTVAYMGSHDTDIWNGVLGCTSQVFDVYFREMIHYFESHRDMGFIFRPHPTFIKGLITKHIWENGDLQIIKQFFDDSENMIYDDSSSYDNALGISDAILTESCTGICYSALPTMKPVCMMYPSEKILRYETELTDNYYNVFSLAQLLDFFDMINRGEDPMYGTRLDAAKKNVAFFDGKNGWRMKELLKNMVVERRR